MDRSCQGVRICFTVEDIPFLVCRNKEWNESLEDDALGERAVKKAIVLECLGGSFLCSVEELEASLSSHTHKLQEVHFPLA